MPVRFGTGETICIGAVSRSELPLARASRAIVLKGFTFVLRVMRYTGQSLRLTTKDGKVVVKVDTVRSEGGKTQVYLALSAPEQVRITREPK